jgi:uncharacterized protein
MAKKVTDKLLIVFLDNQLPVSQQGNSSFEELENHTKSLAEEVDAKRYVYYSNEIIEGDKWRKTHFIKHLVEGETPSEQVKNAFANGFKRGFGRIVCINASTSLLKIEVVRKAFLALNDKQAVLGPTIEGGYYLIGLSTQIDSIFDDKPWDEDTMFKKTYLELMLHKKTISVLEELKLDELAEMTDFAE